jgi:hypothetical protein
MPFIINEILGQTILKTEEIAKGCEHQGAGIIGTTAETSFTGKIDTKNKFWVLGRKAWLLQIHYFFFISETSDNIM